MNFNFLFLFLFLVFASGLTVQYASAFELTHYFEQNATCASTNSTAIALNVTDGTDFDFISGRDYLIIATSTFGGDTSSDPVEMFLAHNQTKFDGGQKIIEPSNGIDTACSAPNDDINKYFFWTVWSPTGTQADEDIVIGVDSTLSSSFVQYDDVTMTILEISEQITEDLDWFHNSNTTDNVIKFNSTAWNSTNNAIIQFTPVDNNDDWLIFGTNTIDTASAVISYMTRLFVNGTETDLPEIIQEGEDPTNEKFVQTFARVLTLPNSTQIIEVQANLLADGAGIHTREYSAIFALNLNKFSDHSFVWTPAELDVTHVGNFGTEVDSISITPSANNTDTVILADIGARDTEEQITLRLQVDQVDDPTGQTTQEYRFLDLWDVADDLRWTVAIVQNMTNSSHTIDVDGGEITNSGAKAVYRSLVAFTLQIQDIILTQQDSFSLTDANNFTAIFTHNQTDNMILNDTNNFVAILTHNQTDTMILNDTNNYVAILTHNQTDTMILNDTNNLVSTLTHNQTDNMILNDTNNFVAILIHDQTDNMILNDTNNFSNIITHNQTDTMILNDTNNFVSVLIHNQTDSMKLNDTNDFVGVFFFNQTENFDMLDSNDFSFAIIENIIDAFGLTELITTAFITPPIPPVVPTGGGGVTSGGTPVPSTPDTDGDGFLDNEDDCPNEAEIFNNFQDSDGCPDSLEQPEPLTVFDLGFPFGFNELSVVDDFINLETDSPQAQVEDLGIRWLGDEPITITKVDIGNSPFEIVFEDLPVEFGNNQFGYTQEQVIYTVQEPNQVCTNIFSFDCVDDVTYEIPVVITGEVRGKTVIADGSLTIDNSNRFNPYWLILLFLAGVPVFAFFYWRMKRKTKPTAKVQLKLTQPNRTVKIEVERPKELKSGTTKKILNESQSTNVLGKKTK
jgi:hypothetical protein